MVSSNPAIEFRLIPFGTPDYQQALDLRHFVLRKPLNLSFGQDQINKEAADYHLGAFFKAHLAGCIVLSAYPGDTIKFRQMAIDKTHQGQGIGKALLQEAESIAKAEGFTTIFLHARRAVSGFYEHMGYTREGDFFKEVTIWHIKMTKKLTAT